MPTITPKPHPDFDEFVATIAALREPDGCPWDREQTHTSIANNMLEEAYEAVDAIEANDMVHLREELGDVLLQVVLQSQIAAEAAEFTIDEVARDVNAKIIRRHPHVFGDLQTDDASEVLDIWDQVKLAEKDAAAPQSLLNSVPKSFPALMQAQKISRKAVSVGFEWDSLDAVWAQVAEEEQELREAYARAPKNAKGKIDAAADHDAFVEAELEFGDVLFSLVNVARRMGIDAESALRATCTKFRSRWGYMEMLAAQQGQGIEELSVAEQNELWEQAKTAGF